jgi:uncharacterized membrane protein
MLAFFLTGALLALFGITYQTGADTYELFVAWALLGLPFTLAGASGAAWAAWWVVMNVAMALFCGWMGPGEFAWGLFDRWQLSKALVLMGPFVANLAGVALAIHLRQPRWLVRLLLTFAFAYGIVSTLSVAAGGGWWRGSESGGQDSVVVIAFAGACAAFAYATLQAKKDVFPMALIIAAWIAISTAAIIHGLKLNDVGGFFLISMWIVATSTAAGFVLMKWVREWKIDEDAPEATP